MRSVRDGARMLHAQVIDARPKLLTRVLLFSTAINIGSFVGNGNSLSLLMALITGVLWARRM
jgi:hypothetical protein